MSTETNEAAPVYTIAEYDEFRAAMAAAALACDFIPDMSTPEGYKKSKEISGKVTKSMSALEARRKELKADSLEYGRRVDGEASPIKEALEKMREPHKAAYRAVDLEKKERDEKRKQDQLRRIGELEGLPSLMMDSDSEGVQMCLEDLRKNDCEGFYEMTEQALLARNASMVKLEVMYTSKLQQEREAVELRELKAIQEREARARAEEQEHAAAKQRELEEHAAAKQREVDAAAAAQQKIIDDLLAEKAERDLKERESEMAEYRAAQEKADQEERERKAEQYRQDEIVELEQQEREAKAREEAAREETIKIREADQAEFEAALSTLTAHIRGLGADDNLTELLVEDIANGHMPHVTFKQ